MSNIQTESTPVDPNIVWGAEAIAPHLGRTVKGTFGALESGKVPGAKKIAGRWALNLRVFHTAFTVAPDQEAIAKRAARKDRQQAVAA